MGVHRILPAVQLQAHDEHRCEMNGFASQFHRCLQHIRPPVILRKSPALAGCSHLALDIARKIGRGVP